MPVPIFIKILNIPQYTVAYWERKSTALKSNQLVELANVLNVSTDFLLGRKIEKKKNGPTGKLRKLFEEVGSLPRHKQQRIIATMEDMLVAQKVKAS